VSIVANFLERQSVEELEQIVDKLVQANTVFLTAFRSSYAVAYCLHFIGRMVLQTLQLFPRHQNSALGDLNDAKEGNVLIAITVTRYSRETVEV
jgi:DNA-binding MurR/RpiR family transcriptional regulator